MSLKIGTRFNARKIDLQEDFQNVENQKPIFEGMSTFHFKGYQNFLRMPMLTFGAKYI